MAWARGRDGVARPESAAREPRLSRAASPWNPGRSPELPSRYAEDWAESFFDFAGSRLENAANILDVGSGRRPAVPPSLRPPGCRYVGLDISIDELQLAPADSYDEIVCDDLVVPRSDLAGRFDLIVSWQVLEHVADPAAVLRQLRGYLTENGRLVALLSGRYSCFGLANRFVPDRLGQRIAAHVTAREPETVFPAPYRDCYYDGLARILSDWRRVKIHPRYRGEIYFRFCPIAHRRYLAYESWAQRKNRRNLATHYFVVAEA